MRNRKYIVLGQVDTGTDTLTVFGSLNKGWWHVVVGKYEPNNFFPNATYRCGIWYNERRGFESLSEECVEAIQSLMPYSGVKPEWMVHRFLESMRERKGRE